MMETLLERETDQMTGNGESPAQSPHQRLLRGYLHKTSNSLCGIKGYASLIAEMGRAAEENGRWARKIISEVERMEAIFASVGDLSGDREHFLAGNTLGQIIDDIMATPGPLRDRLEVTCDPFPPGSLMMPAADLAQVLREILANAAESPGQVQNKLPVHISGAFLDTEAFILSVRDLGPGIPLDMCEQVKDPFVSTKPGHLGIGLTRVETIMDMHQLEWSLSSDLGRGTTVYLEVASSAMSDEVLKKGQ